MDLERITRPLRLAVGSHEPGSGNGCAMNVISYINGDEKITDFPDCSAPWLARMVQIINDHMGRYEAGAYLTPQQAVTVLDLGWRTVGTAAVSASYDMHSLVTGWLAELLDDPTWGAHRHLFVPLKNECRVVADYLHATSEGKFMPAPTPFAGAVYRGVPNTNIYANAAHINAWDAVTYAADFAAGFAAVDAAAHAAAAYCRSGGGVEMVDHYITRWRQLAGQADEPGEISAASVDRALEQIGAS